ncbi:MAG: RHS repeat domain-containing protein [Dysgonomonas sp.]|nr:RHS repeat domain-containing protein [Dysgonomonas sp.]
MKRLSNIAILSFVFISICAQISTDIPNFAPPSPNAQSFLKYGDYPVSTYTGIPNIDIPIYQIRLKDLSFPISISYNASGIKVDEEASRVGLGWILNAGGLITHTIMGRHNDFDEYVYFNDPSVFNLKDLTGIYTFSGYTTNTMIQDQLPFTLPGMTKLDFFSGLLGEDKSCGNIELAPDIFNYNFNGYSGKFIFLRNGEIIKEKEDNLIILPNIDIQNTTPQRLKSWTIITPDGTKYNFNQAECSLLPGKVLAKQNLYPSSFYLTSIQTINGSQINLSYKKEVFYLTATYNREQKSVGTLNDISIDLSTHEQIYLDKIAYSGGEVKFEYSFDRIDYKLEPRLQNIYIKENGINTSHWLFNHNYFVSNTNNKEIPTLAQLKGKLGIYNNHYDESWNQKRLKLNELKHISINNESKTYKFLYNETRLPTKLSSSIDHWGYYNGANNSYLIPSTLQNISQLEGGLEFASKGLGADREANPNYNQAFILKEVIYPTGGVTRFSYETNRYKTDIFENDPHKRDFMYAQKTYLISAYQEQGANNIPHQIESFKVTGTSQKQFEIRAEIILDKQLYIGDPKLEISIKKNINDINSIWRFNVHGNNLLPAPPISENKKITYYSPKISLDPGSYILFVEGNLYKYVKSIEVKASGITVYPEDYLKENYTGIGGGLRIQSINNYNSDGIYVSGKAYKYTTAPFLYDYYSPGYSSGKLMFYPRYSKSWDTMGSNGLRGGGASVGYSSIYEFDTNQKGSYLGGTLYEYINIPDKNLFYEWWDRTLPYGTGPRVKDENPSGIGGYKYTENGTILKETVFESEGTQLIKVKETEYNYGMSGDGPNIVWGVLKSKDITNSGCVQNIDWTEFIKNYGARLSGKATGYLYPAIIPKQIYLNQKKESIFSKDGIVMETFTNYDYNYKYHYLIKETLKSSNAIFKTTEYQYPPDVLNDPLMKMLTDANRINIPITVKQTTNNKVKQFINSYALFNSRPQLSIIKSNTGLNNNLESRIIYHDYDNLGNPVYITKDDAMKVVYLWGYGGQYPIVEIKNATYDNIKSALGEALIKRVSEAIIPSETDLKSINDLRKNTTTLKDAQITTYTYKPLVGVLTITDPSGVLIKYEYDDFGRLIRTKDTDGKTIEEYNYHYKN